MKHSLLLFVLIIISKVPFSQDLSSLMESPFYSYRIVGLSYSDLETTDYFRNCWLEALKGKSDQEKIVVNIDYDQNELFKLENGLSFVNEEVGGLPPSLLNELLEYARSDSNVFLIGNCDFHADLQSLEYLSNIDSFHHVINEQLIITIKDFMSKNYSSESDKSQLIDQIVEAKYKLDTLDEDWNCLYAQTILGKVLFGESYFGANWQAFIMETVEKRFSLAVFSSETVCDMYYYLGFPVKNIYLNKENVNILYGRKNKVLNNKNYSLLGNGYYEVTSIGESIICFDNRKRRYFLKNMEIGDVVFDYSLVNPGNVPSE